MDIDELAIYMFDSFTSDVISDIGTPLGDVSCWLSKGGTYKEPYQVSLRIFATPLSSASHELDFSFVNRLVTADENLLYDDIMKGILYARSALNCGLQI